MKKHRVFGICIVFILFVVVVILISSKVIGVEVQNLGLKTKNDSGKIFITIGDSITARDKQLYGTKEPYVGYQQHIKEALNMDMYINLGISGATIARGTEYLRGLSKLLIDFNAEDVDFIIIQAGTNDFALGVPLGDKSELTKENPDRYNFYGGYVGLVKDLKRNNPNVEIYLWTPTKRDCTKFNNNCTNINGNHLEEYVGVIKQIGTYLDVKVVDMYEIEELTNETLNIYTVDGLHLNNKGYELVAKKFINEYIKTKELAK